jgi:hypothetical protein
METHIWFGSSCFIYMFSFTKVGFPPFCAINMAVINHNHISQIIGGHLKLPHQRFINLIFDFFIYMAQFFSLILIVGFKFCLLFIQIIGCAMHSHSQRNVEKLPFPRPNRKGLKQVILLGWTNKWIPLGPRRAWRYSYKFSLIESMAIVRV